MRHLKTLLILVFAFASHQALSAEWGTYSNPKYGFSVDFPQGVFDTTKESDEGDGITMETLDHSAEFRAYGFMNGDELTLKKVQDIILQDSANRDVTYKRIKNNWIVISGYEMEGERRMIFYQRLSASPTLSSFSAFELIYPENKRALYDPMVKHLSQSLTAPSK